MHQQIFLTDTVWVKNRSNPDAPEIQIRVGAISQGLVVHLKVNEKQGRFSAVTGNPLKFVGDEDSDDWEIDEDSPYIITKVAETVHNGFRLVTRNEKVLNEIKAPN